MHWTTSIDRGTFFFLTGTEICGGHIFVFPTYNAFSKTNICELIECLAMVLAIGLLLMKELTSEEIKYDNGPRHEIHCFYHDC